MIAQSQVKVSALHLDPFWVKTKNGYIFKELKELEILSVLE